MDALFRFFAQRPLTAGLFTTSAIGLGLAMTFMASLSQYADVNTGEVEITTFYPGASPVDVETNVTNKIEEELLTVFEIDSFYSVSRENVSEIDIEFKPGVNVQKANQRVRDAVYRVTDLPAAIQDAPYIQEETTSTFEFMTIGVSGDMTPDELYYYVRDFEDRLRRVPGVGRISFIGLGRREIQIEARPHHLDQYGLSIQELADAIEPRHVSSTAGVLVSDGVERNVVTQSEIRTVKEAGDVLVRSGTASSLVTLDDLADIQLGIERQTEALRINGETVIGIRIEKSATGDVLSTAARIRELMAEEEQREDVSVKFELGYDLSVDIQNRFSIVGWNGLIGFVLVLLILGITLNRHVALWVAISIPVSLLGAVAFLVPITGGLDSVSLSALVLIVGIVVDDSVVVAESIQRHREGGQRAIDAAVNGAKRVFLPVITGMLTTGIVFVPFFFLPGTIGKLVYVIPLAVLLALAISLIECFFALPAHLIKGGEPKGGLKQDRIGLARRAYRSFIRKLLVLRYPVAAGILVAVVVLGGFVLKSLDFIFFPTDAGRVVEIHTVLDPGLTLESAKEISGKLERILEDLDEEELMSWYAIIAPPEIEYTVSLTHLTDRERSVVEIVKQLKEDTKDLKGFQSIAFEIQAGGPPVGVPVEARLLGGSDEVRSRLSQDLIAFLSALPGVVDPRTSDTPVKDEIRLDLDTKWMARLGVTPFDAARTLRMAHEGVVVVTTWEGREPLDIRVRLPEGKGGIDRLLDLKVRSLTGDLVPIGQFARTEVVRGSGERLHWNGHPYIVITADLDFNQSTPNAIEEAALAWFDSSQYPGVTLEFGGQVENTEEAANGLLLALIAAFVGIYFLLALLFNSLVQPVLILSVVPAGFVAVGLALVFHGQPLSFTGAIGAIGLIGLIVNGVIVMVHAMNSSCSPTSDEPMRYQVADAASVRFRPIMLTVLTTSIGLIPLAYGLGGVDIFMGPLALALGFGVVLSAPVVLTLIPCLYMIMLDLGMKKPESGHLSED